MRVFLLFGERLFRAGRLRWPEVGAEVFAGDAPEFFGNINQGDADGKTWVQCFP